MCNILFDYCCSVTNSFELQHTRLPCCWPSPGVCSDSCALSRSCHSTISSFAVPCPPAFNFSQPQGLFQWVGSPHQVAKVWNFSFSITFLWVFRVDFLWDWLVWSPCCSRDSKESSPHHNLKASIIQRSAFFIVQLLHPYMTTGEKTIALTIQTFVNKVMSLLFNMLPRFVTDFLPRSKHLLISWLQSLSAVILEPKKIKSVTVSTFLPYSC